MNINWKFISDVISTYKSLGYQYIEVPWFVSFEATYGTIPLDKKPFELTDGKFLPGSAEQSYIDMMMAGLKQGKYVTASPCFRDDEIDEFHAKHFFKVELIDFSKPNKEKLISLLCDAIDTIKSLPNGLDSYIKRTDEGFDIILHGVEVGSYGIRKYKSFEWVYGTGLAEPRFSIAAALPNPPHSWED